MTPSVEESAIRIRDVESVAEIREVEELQKEVWGIGDLDVVPLTQLVAAKHCGGVLVGAFDGAAMVGFAYGFVGREGAHTGIHSHMLAVRPAYRNSNLGYRLKLAQRERALAAGLTRMTWTFDPLQSLNAHFNFAKLGVVSDRYEINFYGEETSSFLHRTGTDRLWVSWPLDSLRVARRIEGGADARGDQFEDDSAERLVRVAADGSPRPCESAEAPSRERALIEISRDAGLWRPEGVGAARAWREATRRAFTRALAAGYVVEDFYRQSRSEQQIGVYVLRRGKTVEDYV